MCYVKSSYCAWGLTKPIKNDEKHGTTVWMNKSSTWDSNLTKDTGLKLVNAKSVND